MWIWLGLGSSSGSFTTNVAIPSEFNPLASASAAALNFSMSAEVNPISTPLRPPICPTTWPLRNFDVRRNDFSSETLYSHPAESTAASISLNNFSASVVSVTASSYGVRTNSSIRCLTCSCWYSSSIRSSACCFNRLRSLSKEAASCLASRAIVKAFDAEVFASWGNVSHRSLTNRMFPSRSTIRAGNVPNRLSAPPGRQRLRCGFTV
jgi:hypothetical protein